MRKRASFCTALLMAAAALLLFSPGAGLAEEGEELRALREENAQMREMLREQEKRLARLEEASTDGKKVNGGGVSSAAKGFKFGLSGFLKSDMLWNNNEVNSGSAPRFATARNGAGDQFGGTVQHSRLRLSIEGPELQGGTKLGGYLEMDFFNLGDSTNFTNNQLRVRELYTTIETPEFTVLIGQAWDLFGPLNANTLNTNGNLWFGGNVGFRRPQVQVRRRFEFGDGFALTPAASINANDGLGTDDSLDTGRDSGMPLLEGSLVAELPLFGDRPLELGFWGMYGEDEVKGVRNSIDKWGIGGHFVARLQDWLLIQGEVHYGGNLDSFVAGGAFSSTGSVIKSTGGFVQVTLDPIENVQANLLFGIDDPENDHLVAGDRDRNQVLMANLKYTVFEYMTLGVEYERFDTDFKNGSGKQADLFWFSGALDF